jgi:hypothetical protein
VLRAHVGTKRLKLTDRQRRAPAENGKVLRLLLEATRPQPLHKDALAISTRRWLVGALDLYHVFDSARYVRTVVSHGKP